LSQVEPVSREDVTEISCLARQIWLRQYQGLLSQAQIDYMLMQRYSPSVIKTQLDDEKTWWRKLVLNENIIGFSCYLLTQKPDELKIDKLYIHHDHHRKGYGKVLIEDAEKILRKIRGRKLILTVNKQNHSAIHAYRSYGFEMMGDSVVDIGGGFFMNDYLMTMKP